MIFQDANLLPWRNLWQNIQLPVRDQEARPQAVRGAHPGAARRGRPGRVREEDAARALRRHAAARQHRALPLLRSRRDPDGRAVRRARRLHPRRDEPAHPEDLDGDRQDDRLRHPQRLRGDLPGRPGRRAHAAAGAPGAHLPDRPAAPAHDRHDVLAGVHPGGQGDQEHDRDGTLYAAAEADGAARHGARNPHGQRTARNDSNIQPAAGRRGIRRRRHHQLVCADQHEFRQELG